MVSEHGYLTLEALAAYSGLSVRTLRRFLHRQTAPLPYYTPGGKVLVKRSDFDAWITMYRRASSATAAEDTGRVVDDLLASLTRTPRQGDHAR